MSPTGELKQIKLRNFMKLPYLLLPQRPSEEYSQDPTVTMLCSFGASLDALLSEALFSLASANVERMVSLLLQNVSLLVPPIAKQPIVKTHSAFWFFSPTSPNLAPPTMFFHVQFHWVTNQKARYFSPIFGCQCKLQPSLKGEVRESGGKQLRSLSDSMY